MNRNKYTGKEGKLISAADATALTEPHLSREREIIKRGENFVKAEFFGIHTFNELIGMHGENCIGFRVYYGLRDEEDNSMDRKDNAAEEQEISGRKDKKKPTSRLIVVPVGRDGRDLTKTAQLGGMKDMPADREVMVGGPVCPRHC